MKRFGLLVAMVAVLLASGCTEKMETPDMDLADNPYKRLEISTKAAEYVQQGNTFAFEFIDRINAAEKGDFFVSPLSMQFLLGMLLDGAQGQTADEICKVFGFGAGEVDAVNEYCLSMLQQLPELDKLTRLNIANAIFVNNRFPLLDSYKNSVGKYFHAEVSNLDFSNASGSLKAINGWCNKQTEGLIPKVLDKVSPNDLAYLLNAMYFKSEWTTRFPKENTKEESFRLDNGATVKVPMMKNNARFQYSENDIFRAVRLPYGNTAYSMIVTLPAEGHTVSDVTAAMKDIDILGFVGNMVAADVDLWLPKFETKYSIELKDILSEMGMPSSFNGSKADFKAMSDYALCLSSVKQDAVIKVDEEKTEAAAVSIAREAHSTYIQEIKKVVFHAERPFMYLIAESSTGAILFAGKYTGK